MKLGRLLAILVAFCLLFSMTALAADAAQGESPEQAAQGESVGEDSPTGESEVAEPAEGEVVEGESAEGESAEGESAEGESAEGESAEGESAEGESEGDSGMDGNQAASDVAPEGSVNISTGETVLEGEEISVWEGSAIQNNGDSVIVARNCTISADTATPTAPLAGLPGNLLVAGNIRATLAMGHAQSFYINSTVTSRNWATLSTDGGEPAQAEGEKEVSVYAYGTYAAALDGGYGAFSDLFCNVYAYGSHLQSPELGIISGTYGAVTVGTIGDGEADEAVAAYLTDEDKAAHEDKEEGSLIEGGRNAIMIMSVSLPPYWAYEGYTEEKLPFYSTQVNVHGSTLKTDLGLFQGIFYDEQKQAYIDHTNGSVILIKSTNADIALQDSEMIADPAGTGYAVQSVYNNDTMFMMAVPDGEQYPGITVNAVNSTIEGSIAHEDYQRDFWLTLDNSTLTGAMNEYDCAHWNEAAAAEGFTDYALDASYATEHGLFVTLENGAVWNVTAESSISGLTIAEGCTVNGTITVDGEAVEAAGEYSGNIIVVPADAAPDQGGEAIAQEESAGESAEGESAEGDSAEGESGEDAAPAEGDSAEGDSAEGESGEDAAPAEGDSAEGDSAEGESAEGESAGGDSAAEEGESSGDSGGSSGESEPEPVEILTETTEFPDGITIEADGYYGAPDGYCVIMVVDGAVVAQNAGTYEGSVILEVVPKTSSAGASGQFSTKSLVTKTADGLTAVQSALNGTVDETGIYGADITADMPHLSIATVVNGEYRIEDSSFYLLQTGLHTSGGDDFSGDGCAIAATEGSVVTVKNVNVISDGITRTNLFGGVADHDSYPTYYIVDSTMTANGDPEGADGAVWVLGLHGQVRTAMFDDYYANYFYNTTLNSIGWAVLAVDGVGSPAAGDLDEFNSRYVENQGYVDENGEIMNTAEFVVAATGLTDEYLAALAAVDGEEALKALPELNDNSLFFYAGKNIVTNSSLITTGMDEGHTGYATYSIGANATIFSGTTIDCSYGAVQSNEYSTVAFVNGTKVNASKSVLMNFAHRGGVCYVADSELTAGEMAFAIKGSGDGYKESIGEGNNGSFNLMGGPTGTNLYVRNTKITAPVLLAAFDCDDPGDMGSTQIVVNDEIAPKDETYDVTELNHWREPVLFWGAESGTFMFNEIVNVYFQDCVGETALNGNIYNCHQWTSKNMNLTLDNCEINGAITSGWCEHEVDIIDQSMGSLEEPFTDEEGLVHGNRENMGKVTCHASETVNNGVIVTLTNGSVWNVTETSYITVLNVDETSVVNGTVTELESGVIMVEPAN